MGNITQKCCTKTSVFHSAIEAEEHKEKSEVKASKAKASVGKASEVKGSEVKDSAFKASVVKASEAKVSDVKASEVKASVVKASVLKSEKIVVKKSSLVKIEDEKNVCIKSKQKYPSVACQEEEKEQNQNSQKIPSKDSMTRSFLSMSYSEILQNPQAYYELKKRQSLQSQDQENKNHPDRAEINSFFPKTKANPENIQVSTSKIKSSVKTSSIRNSYVKDSIIKSIPEEDEEIKNSRVKSQQGESPVFNKGSHQKNSYVRMDKK